MIGTWVSIVTLLRTLFECKLGAPTETHMYTKISPIFMAQRSLAVLNQFPKIYVFLYIIQIISIQEHLNEILKDVFILIRGLGFESSSRMQQSQIFLREIFCHAQRSYSARGICHPQRSYSARGPTVVLNFLEGELLPPTKVILRDLSLQLRYSVQKK